MIVTSTHLSNLMKTKRKCREISFPFFLLGWFDGAGSLYFPLILKVVLYVFVYIDTQDIFVYVCMYVCRYVYATLGYTSLSFMMKSQTRKWNTWINRSGYFHVMDINDVLVIELFFFLINKENEGNSCSLFNLVHDMEFFANT